MLVDSHCHLDYAENDAEREEILSRARRAGIGTLVTIGTKISQFPEVRRIAEGHDDVWCTVGIHPHEAGIEADIGTARLVELSHHPKVIGIGETGLDFYYDHSPREKQAEVFRTHIAAARETGLPLIVHTRDADELTADILRQEIGKGPFTGVIHCFTSSMELAETALELGFYISFSGIVTFKNAEALREVVRRVPSDRFLVETDAPYLAPVPKRGKPNEPAFVVHTAAKVAELRGLSDEALAQQTTENFFRLFTKAAPAA